MDEKGLGKRLQAARQAAGMTQQVLCQKAKLSYSTLTKIERGAIKSPSIFTIQNIAEALGVGLDALMGITSPARPQKHRSKSGISFVYFDINGCLVRFFHRAFTQLAQDTGAPADIIETTFWHYNDLVCRGEMSMDDFNAAYAKVLGQETMDWQKYYLDSVEPIEDMRALVEWAGANFRIGLLTNIMPGFVQVMRDRKMLPEADYEIIIDSSEVKTIKPETQIYEIAAERAGCPTNEILLVDDSRTNLMAAEKHGWHVLWFDDYRPEESVARIKGSLEIV